MGTRVLLVEDDETIGAALVDALTANRYAATWVRDGAQAAAAVGPGRPELILLDLGLPDVDGVDLSRLLRAEAPDAVIVVLTARTGELDVVVALDAGADDYLTKPFRSSELLARLRAHLRRRPTRPDAVELRVGRLRLDVWARRALVAGAEMALRPKEFDLLAVLVAAAGRAVSRERLMAEVWDEHWFGSTKTLDVHVCAVRRKLAECGESPERITTLRGHGYRYEAGD